MNPNSENVLRIIRQHQDKNYVEIEFRLGRKNSNYFDTNVGKKAFDEALKSLRKYKEWENVIEKTEVIYYGQRKGLRIVYDEISDQQVCVTKHSVFKDDYVLPANPFDIRMAVNIEIPSTYNDEKDSFPTTKRRIRTSFIRKGLSIDVSQISLEGDGDKDEESQTQYQIEFEILNPKELDDNKSYNHYQKIFDLLACFSSGRI